MIDSKISIINLKHNPNCLNDSIYIGRQNKYFKLRQSILHNPFIIGKDGNRQEVLEKYRIYLWNEIKSKSIVYEELCRITNLAKNGVEIKLACYCKPQSCHGDIIVNAINWMLNNE